MIKVAVGSNHKVRKLLRVYLLVEKLLVVGHIAARVNDADAVAANNDVQEWKLPERVRLHHLVDSGRQLLQRKGAITGASQR